MKIVHIIFLLALCWLLFACDANPDTTPQTLPTVARFPTLTATIHPSESPTSTATTTSTPTGTNTATITPIPSHSSRLNTLATGTIMPISLPSATATSTPLPAIFTFGQSAGERDLIAYRYGSGQHIIMLVAGIHAGFEANTVDLMEEIRTHLQNNPASIASNVTFLIIPVLNPDGLARGRVIQGRFNANGVDLNRNWACGWSPDAVFGDDVVDAGSEAFSEPESTALGSLIQRVRPSGVIFYHSAANGVFAGNCADGQHISGELAALYGEVSGYPYGETFNEYPVTGTAPAWVDSLGIPALDVELSSATATEFNRNLRAIMAIQDWIQNNP